MRGGLACALAASWLAGCAGMGGGAAPTERAQVRPMLISGMGVMQVPQLQRRIEAIEARLLAVAPGTGPAPHIFLVPTTDFVAEAGPDGGIFISLGTLESLHSDDAMAFVVGHELGHVRLGHTSRSTVQDWSHSARVLGMGALRMASHSTLQVSKASDLAQAPIRSAAIGAGLGDLADDLLFPGWNRDQERAADQFGLDVMVKAGYSPAGADEVFERLEAADKRREVLAARADALAKAAGRPLPNSVQAASAAAANAVTNQVKEWLGQLQGERTNTHGAASDRHALVANAIETKYADAPANAQLASWSAAMATPDTAARLNAYRLLNRADDAFFSGRSREAGAAMGRIDASPIANESRAVDLRAHLLTSSGGREQARQVLQASIPGPMVILDVYVLLINLDLQANRIDDAVATMRQARKALDDPQEMYPTDLIVMRRAKLDVEKQILLGRCYLVGDDDLSKQCKTAAGA